MKAKRKKENFPILLPKTSATLCLKEFCFLLFVVELKQMELPT